MESWFCIWSDLANPKIGLNLVPNPLVASNKITKKNIYELGYPNIEF